MRFFRPTLRIRMALLYGVLMVLTAGAVLFIATVLLDRAMTSSPVLGLSGTVVSADGTRTVLPAGAGRQVREQAQDQLLRDGALFLGVVVLVGAAGGYLMARQAFAPVARVTRTAQQLSTKTLKQRIALGGPDDELRELADTFDDMLGRLDAAFESQRMFVANASHELRTPLAVMRTELDVTLADPEAPADELRRMGDVLIDATGRAQHLVDSLLILARLQAGDRADLDTREPVDLAEFVPAVVRSVRREAAARDVTLEADVDSAPAVGDPRLLERVMGNLVENAIRYNVVGGTVHLATGHDLVTGRSWLEVENTGPVVPPETVETLFEPFRRGAGKVRTANKGAGLGLAIVRTTVGAHGGTVVAHPRPGGGLRIRVELRPGGTTDAALRRGVATAASGPAGRAPAGGSPHSAGPRGRRRRDEAVRGSGRPGARP